MSFFYFFSILSVFFFFFFFSSRRRHTRFDCDWSSDVCSSDLSAGGGAPPAVLMLADLREGVKGKAIYFTDNEVGILGKGVGYYERTQPFSIDLWVKAGQVYEDSTILHHRETENAGNAGYQLHLEKNHVRWEMMHARAGNGISVLSKQPIPLNEWVHLTVTYDGSSRAAGTAIYVNGARADIDVTRDNLTR